MQTRKIPNSPLRNRATNRRERALDRSDRPERRAKIVPTGGRTHIDSPYVAAINRRGCIPLMRSIGAHSNAAAVKLVSAWHVPVAGYQKTLADTSNIFQLCSANFRPTMPEVGGGDRGVSECRPMREKLARRGAGGPFPSPDMGDRVPSNASRLLPRWANPKPINSR